MGIKAMEATIKFETDEGRYWTIRRKFNDEAHCDNFIKYVCRTKGYTLDEVWY